MDGYNIDENNSNENTKGNEEVNPRASVLSRNDLNNEEIDLLINKSLIAKVHGVAVTE